MKLIILILGLGLGFGGGIWFGVHNPQWASDFAAKEEEWVNKGKMQATQAVKEKLDKILDKQPGTPAAGFGSSLLGGGSGGSTTDELKKLRDEQDQMLKQMASSTKK
jgi:hypothetical protein